MIEQFEKSVEEVATRWVDDITLIKPSDVPDTLFHYTDAAGLVGMLSHHKIWLTDMRFLNDKTELIHTRNLVENVFDQFRSHSLSKISEALIKRIRYWQEEDSEDEVFSFSLSAKGDDLSQWRGYAKEGHGFTIGFSGSKMMEAHQKSDSFSFAQVHYNKNKQIHALLMAIRDIADLTEKQCAADPSRAEDYIDSAAAFYDWIVESRSALNKHHSFVQEDEWRVFSYNIQNDDEESVKVRSSGLRLIPYLEETMSDGSSSRLPIACIGIGPALAGGPDIHAIKALCRANGYNPDIYYADTPYRSM